MCKQRIVLLAAATGLLALAGCATPLQRQAQTDWEQAAPSAPAALAPSPVEAGAPADLADFLRLAEQNNPGLQAARQRWKAMLERIPQERALPDPKLGVSTMLREADTPMGMPEDRLAIMQEVPWPSKLRLGGDMAAREATVERRMYEAQRLELLASVRSTYYEYWALGRSIEIVKENMQLLQNLEAVVRIRYAAGAAEHPNLIQTQVELGKLENELKTLEIRQPAVVAKLNAALGRDSRTPIPWPQGALKDQPPLDHDALLTALAEHNPELEAARERLRATEVGQELAKTRFYPDFGVRLSVQNGSQGEVMTDLASGRDPIMLMLEFTLPLWAAKNRAAVREANAKRDAASFDAADRLNKLSAELRMALYEYDDARRKVNLYRDTLIPKAQQALAAAQTTFAAGKGSFLEVIDAERNLLEFRLMAERMLADQASRLADLERLAGRSLRQEESSPPVGPALSLPKGSEPAGGSDKEPRTNRRQP